jgi:uncharacterized protein YjdB
MMQRTLVVASLVLVLAACAQGVTSDPDADLPQLGGVRVLPREANLFLGAQETEQLNVTVTGIGSFDGSVTWTSDDPSIATVNQSGLVTAIEEGAAIVTATSNFDSSGSDSATIHVRRAVVITDVTPAVSSNLVPIDTVLTATFNVAMDPSTIDDTTFTLLVASVPVTGAVSYEDASRTATFTPDVPLEPDSVYEAAIGPEVRSASGGTLRWGAGTTEPTRFAWAFWTAPIDGTGPTPSIGGIDVTPAEATIVRGGDPLQLTATLTDVVGNPNRGVTWSSNATSVATVSAAGEVTAVAAGVATITARSVFDPTVSGSAIITVEPAPSSIGGIDVTPATATIVLGGDPVQLTATATGVVGDPNRGVTWSSNTPSVATVSSSGLVSAVGIGEATITATSTFDSTKSGSAAITVRAASVLSLDYPDSPYAYVTGAVFTIDPAIAGASGPVSYEWQRIDGGGGGASESNWSINASTGQISRTGGGGSNNNMLPIRNGDRTYRVTVRDGSASDTFDVQFVETAPAP